MPNPEANGFVGFEKHTLFFCFIRHIGLNVSPADSSMTPEDKLLSRSWRKYGAAYVNTPMEQKPTEPGETSRARKWKDSLMKDSFASV